MAKQFELVAQQEESLATIATTGNMLKETNNEFDKLRYAYHRMVDQFPRSEVIALNKPEAARTCRE